MMVYPVVFAPEAIEDLKNIWDDVFERSQEKDVATSFKNRIIQYCFDQVAIFPESGSLQDEIEEGLRKRVYKNTTKIFYFFNGEEVEIYRIVRSWQSESNIF